MPIEVFVLLLFLLLIFIFFAFIMYKQHQVAKTQSTNILNQIENLLAGIRPYLNYEFYLDKQIYKDFLVGIKHLSESMNFFVDELLRGNPIYTEFTSLVKKCKDSRFHNKLTQEYISIKLKQHDIKELFDHFNNVSLDEEQRVAVVTDDRAALVVAAAGSGKTLTIAAKVAYLVKFQKIDPSKILLITFTKKASEEMENRVSKAIIAKIQAYTFHKLGLSILIEKLGYKPSILEEDYLDNIINDYIKTDLKQNSEAMRDFIELFAYYSSEYKDESEFESRTAYVNDMKSSDLETLKSKCYGDKQERKTLYGEQVKSLAELQIANFLFINGIEYEYESKYKHDTATKLHRQYQPDFYLPQYDIYIEHYGVDENNRAKWLNPSEENKYIRGMDWKRSIHKENNTICIETFAYMARKGILLTNLRNMLQNHRVEFHEIANELIIDKLIERNTRYFSEFQKLIKTFILLLKESGKSDIDESYLLHKLRTKHNTNFSRAKLFTKLVLPIMEKYQKHLHENNLIDFADMINQASNYLQDHTVKDYDYIIIDEYQDISESKSKLIDSIIRNTNAKLFCVGDDWQSIFRFAGSDIYQFTSFVKRYEYSILQKIQKTYRNPQELVDIASKFIMKNKSQITKKIISTKQLNNPLHLYAQTNLNIIQLISSVIENIIKMHDAREVLILGRYNFDLDSNDLAQIRSQYPDLIIDFLTVHKAKGLEAEHVIIINNKNHVLGFPSKIADDELLTMVLSHQDEFPYSEERRLFYVALTRAKYTCHLIIQSNQSIFIEELKQNKNNIEFHDFDKEIDHHKCPRCDGHLVIRSGNENEFYGCSNYPYCEYTAAKNINFDRKCEYCGDYMVKRKGSHGWFWGCNSYKDNECPGTSK